jgi:hypothetical protein
MEVEREGDIRRSLSFKALTLELVNAFKGMANTG